MAKHNSKSKPAQVRNGLNAVSAEAEDVATRLKHNGVLVHHGGTLYRIVQPIKVVERAFRDANLTPVFVTLAV